MFSQHSNPNSLSVSLSHSSRCEHSVTADQSSATAHLLREVTFCHFLCRLRPDLVAPVRIWPGRRERRSSPPVLVAAFGHFLQAEQLSSLRIGGFPGGENEGARRRLAYPSAFGHFLPPLRPDLLLEGAWRTGGGRGRLHTPAEWKIDIFM